MTIIKHELSQNRKSFFIWTGAITFLLVICVLLFPEMKSEMGTVSDMFASMGFFTDAFRMDQIDFGTFLGFYTIECGNILGLGGAFFASLIAIASLAKEEKDHTSEFLLSHPVSRTRVISEKLASILLQVLAMNIALYLFSTMSALAIGETVPWTEMTLLHVAYLLMQLEIAGICFGLSAFLSRGGLGLGLGLSTLLYFLNIIGNLTERAKFLKYVTPFGYTEGADIITEKSLDPVLITIGMTIMVLFIVAGYYRYNKKDLK